MSIRTFFLCTVATAAFGVSGAISSVGAADLPVKAPPPVVPVSMWEVEVGSRVWFSSGSIGAPNPLLNVPNNVVVSRLLYKNETAISGEVFGRLDHSSGVFVKANAGLGRIDGGEMYDEDFPGGGAYSNTLQNNNTGHIYYGSGDIGYDILTGPGGKVGVFIGYGYYGQHVDTFGCTQLAAADGCNPAQGSPPVPPTFNGVSEDDAFGAVRLGLSSQFHLTDRIKFTAEAAWLPAVRFWGQDNHNTVGLIINEASGSGDGVQLEAILSYAVTDALEVGVGGRYWTWNMRGGISQFNFDNPARQFTEPSSFNSERYGVFAQVSYHWGSVTPDAARPAGYFKAPPEVWSPNWSGVYVGGFLGGGVGDDRWSDRFGTNSIPGLIFDNIAGFGDSTHASGPLGGAEIGINGQSGMVVYGLEADASFADIRGQNTCFSGLGGVNCMRDVKELATFTGRAGVTWDRTLLYVKGGGAWSDTNYSINANTGVGGVTLGVGSVTASAVGWTLGGGLEYALNSKWSGKVEYDYIDFGGKGLTFGTVAVIGAAPVSVQQNVNVMKVGIDYKLN